MVFDATFEKNSAILWQSALLMEETKVPGENHYAACRKSRTNFTTSMSGIRTHHPQYLQ